MAQNPLHGIRDFFICFYFMHAPLLQVILHASWLLPILLYIILLCIQFGDSTTYKFILYNLSNVMLSVNFLKVLLYLLMRISLLMGHFFPSAVLQLLVFSFPAPPVHNHILYGLQSVLLFCMSKSDCL